MERINMLTEDDLAAKVGQAFGEQAGRSSPADFDAAGIFRRGRRRRHRQLATRVGSVAAAAGLVAGVVTASFGSSAPTRVAQSPTHATVTPTSTAQPSGSQLPGNVLLNAAFGPALPAAAADAGMPEYYIVSAPDALTTNALQVRSSTTGKVISSVAQPAGCVTSTYQIAATGSDRDFFVSCLTTSRNAAFYRLHISAQGVITAFTPMPVSAPSNVFVTGLAVTPDGSKLAIGLENSKTGAASIEVVMLATGATRTWAGPHMNRPTELTWADNGRELGFWTWGLRVLDVGAAGSSLSSAHLILSGLYGSDLVQDAMLSPDGTTIIAYVSYQESSHVRTTKNSRIGGIVEIDARTKKPLRVLIAQHPQGNSKGWYITPFELGAIDSTGNHLLVAAHQFGRLDRGRFTALPGDQDQVSFASAW
jgi:hypothetical protein